MLGVHAPRALAPILFCAGALVALYVVIESVGSASDGSAVVRRDAGQVSTGTSHDATPAVQLDTASFGNRTRTTSAGLEDEGESGGVGEDRPSAADALREARQSLRMQIEGTLQGTLDPAALLEVALHLAELEVDPRAVPEPHPSGALRFPLRGLPEGMKAEMWIDSVANAKFAPEVLSLRLELAPEREPYVVGGVPRASSEVTWMLWTDRERRLQNFSIFTALQPQGPVVAGEINEGLLYSVDFVDPAKDKLYVHGRRDGSPAKPPVSTTLTGASLDPARAEMLKEAMLHNYGRIRQ